MTPPRRTAALVATATTTALLLSAQPSTAAPSARQTDRDAAQQSRQSQQSPQDARQAERIAKPSLRGSLTDQNFYFVMADRFNNGDTVNDQGGYSGDRTETGYDPTSKRYYHGGDIAGLQAKLDYLQGLGTEAIWFTPIFKNKPVQSEDGPAGTDGSAGYHGYWITDFTQIDPHLGTNAELGELVEAAHDRGMKVFFDIITNHTADVISYESNAREGYTSKDAEPYRDASGTPFDDREYAGGEDFPPLDAQESFPYLPELERAEEDLKVPNWLNDTRYYHNRGNTDFQREDEDQQYGDFAGLDDLFTEHPRVVRGMEKIYKTWVTDIGIDGYRIDTMKHVNDEFWQEFGPGVLRYARQNGKPEFYMFGEVYDDRPTEAGKAFTSKFVTRDKMQAILDFPFQAAARNFVSKQQDAGRPGRLLPRRRLLHRPGLQRLPAPDLPREPRHGPHRLLPQAGQPRGRRGGAARPRPARPRADVPRAWQPRRLLRRRAGLHRQRRRPARPPGHVRQRGGGLGGERRSLRLRQHRQRRDP